MNAKTDENGKATILGTLQSDGITPIPIKINPVNKAVKVIDATTGTASVRVNASIDDNGRPVWLGVSSADMTTIIPVATDINGNLLIKST